MGEVIRIAIGGLNKSEMEKAIKDAGGDKVQVIVTTDLSASKMLKNNEADYYFGACNSGGGAAISILIGMLGYNKCLTVAMAGGKKMSKEDIKKHIDDGKIAFGMAVEGIKDLVPVLVNLLLEKN